MKSIEKIQSPCFDEEWVSLMIFAKKIGLSPKEVREFIRKRYVLKGENPRTES